MSCFHFDGFAHSLSARKLHLVPHEGKARTVGSLTRRIAAVHCQLADRVVLVGAVSDQHAVRNASHSGVKVQRLPRAGLGDVNPAVPHVHDRPEPAGRLRARQKRRGDRRRLHAAGRPGSRRNSRAEGRALARPRPARRDRLRDARTVQPFRPHAAVRERADRSADRPRDRGDGRSEPARLRPRSRDAARSRYRSALRAARERSAGAEHRLRVAHVV